MPTDLNDSRDLTWLEFKRGLLKIGLATEATQRRYFAEIALGTWFHRVLICQLAKILLGVVSSRHFPNALGGALVAEHDCQHFGSRPVVRIETLLEVLVRDLYFSFDQFLECNGRPNRVMDIDFHRDAIFGHDMLHPFLNIG